MRIAIIAIEEELSLVRQELGNPPLRQRRGGGSLWVSKRFGHDIFLARTGIGKVNAAICAQSFIDQHDPDLLLNMGSAGAIASQLSPGSVIVARRLVQHDAGLQMPDVFLHSGVSLNSDPDDRLHPHFDADPTLVDLALQAATRAGARHQFQVLSGVIATGDQVVMSSKHKTWLQNTFDALAVEQEGAVIAQVALSNRLPWLVLRGISDEANDAYAIDFRPLMPQAGDPDGLPGRVVRNVRRARFLAAHPHALPRLQRWEHNLHLVNRHLWQTLQELLPALPPS